VTAATKRVAAVLLAVVLALQLVAVLRGAKRDPHHDETEYLHAAWLMSKGERLYTSFFEHHPPFLFGALSLIATDDIPAFYVRARLLSGAFALIALGSLAAIVWRLRPEAAPIALAILLASMPLWVNGLAAARAEPFALAFFWGGAALVLLPRDSAVAAGVGLASIFIAALWNPKWPLSSAIVFAFWLVRTRRRALSAAIAVTIAIPALLALRLFATFDELWFFVVEFNRANYQWLGNRLEGWTGGGAPFYFAPHLLRWTMVVPAVVLAVLFVARKRIREAPLVLFVLSLVVASVLELRFVFPYPVLWSYYFLMYGFAAAALVACAPFLLEWRIASNIVAVALVLVVATNLIAVAPLESPHPGPYWTSTRYFASHLRAGDTLLVETKRHPVGARDASYYWFGFFNVIPSLRQTPRGARYLPPDDHPICAARARFISDPRRILVPPDEQRCFERLPKKPTPIGTVYEVLRQ
jgi:hypothetical protein